MLEYVPKETLKNTSHQENRTTYQANQSNIL